MKITPLDNLMYTSARLANEFVVFKQFHELIKTTTPIALEFKEWNHDWRSSTLPKIPEKLWSQGMSLCVFTDRSIVPGIYNCSISGGEEGHSQELFITDLPCYLEAVLLFRRTETSFDAIPLMRVTSTVDGVFPEYQLRFDWHDDTQEWLYQISPTGFVNAFVYEHTRLSLSPENRAIVAQNLAVLANSLLRYLGAYETYLNKPGKWDVFNPKQARILRDKNGDVKKIYRLGQVGYRHYVAAKPGA